MARYLLVEFDDDAQADALRAQIDAATRKGKNFRVVGMFARPSRWCQCLASSGTFRARNLIKGKKFGWWICPDCRRPRLGDHQATNLLTEDQLVGNWESPLAFDAFSSSKPMRQWVYWIPELYLTIMPRRP